MDAPPPMEDCRPFVAVAELLRSLSLTVPVVIDAELDAGFILMTDLGSTQYLNALQRDPGSADRLYADAVDALVAMQQRYAAKPVHLPVYEESRLRDEMNLFRDWLCQKHLNIRFSPTESRAWSVLADLLVTSASAQDRVIVHRDYHSRNLMVVNNGNPGILDFQDAVIGPLTYDLVSLLKDCYWALPTSLVSRFLTRFCDARDACSQSPVDRRVFRRSFDLMGVQRHLKAAGIFARLQHRDGKPNYMPDVPRTLGYIVATADDYPELNFLSDLIRNRCLPGLGATG